jgi:endonuclease III
MTLDKQFTKKIVKLLAAAYPDAKCALDFEKPHELVVATILSAQCTDVKVNEVSKTLFRKYPTVADFARADLKELERDVQPTGFYRNKAKSVQGCCKMLLERFDGRVPNTMDELIELPGVGRKTANVILGVIYGIAVGVTVDTHVIRLSHRIGLSKEKSPEKIERDLMAEFPQSEWIMLSHRLVFHGRRCCTARKPQCDICPLNAVCPKIL